MALHMSEIAINGLYLLALINPISKVSVLSVLASEEQREGFRAVTTKSTIAAVGILFGAMVFGDFLLRTVFHVELYPWRSDPDYGADRDDDRHSDGARRIGRVAARDAAVGRGVRAGRGRSSVQCH